MITLFQCDECKRPFEDRVYLNRRTGQCLCPACRRRFLPDTAPEAFELFIRASANIFRKAEEPSP